MNHSSTQPIRHPTGQIDKKLLDEIRRRFVLLGQYRWQRLLSESTSGRKQVLEVLAMLLHENHPRLPGYAGRNTPSGIQDFKPTQNQIASTRKLSRSYRYKRHPRHQCDIRAVYLMGSAGTLGEEPNSDLDVWVFYQEGLSPESITALQRKAAAIELWAGSLGVDLHLYVMPPDYFYQPRAHAFSIGQEHCGTSQQYLLLEEFYRSHVWIAGAYPLWWLVPPEEENNYRNYVDRLVRQRFLDTRSWLDIGDISHLPEEEFLGAALWHLHKSVESPYKSNIKMMLMEAYFSQKKDFSPVATQLKASIYNGLLNPKDLDPYVAMYRYVEHFLQAQRDGEALEWVRHCLYMKASVRLSDNRARHNLWRAQRLKELCQQWQWNDARLRQLDRLMTRPDFSVLQMERARLMRQLFQRYEKFKTHYRQSHIQPTINQADLHAVGRKLSALFDSAPDKVEQLHLNFLRHNAEVELTVVQRGGVWLLFSGVLERIPMRTRPLSRQPSFCHLMAWAITNGVLQKETHWHWLDQSDNVMVARARSLVRQMVQIWPFDRHPPTLEQFQTQPIVAKAVWVINAPPQAKRKKMERVWITSNTNPLSFGKFADNLLKSLDLITGNSWGELHHHRFSGLSALTGFFMALKDWHAQQTAPDQFWLSMPGPLHEILKQYLEQLAKLWHTCLIQKGRLLLRAENQYLLLDACTGELSTASDANDLFELLALRPKNSAFQPLLVAPHTMNALPLELLCRVDRQASWECFIYKTSRQTNIWLVDDTGGIAYYPCAHSVTTVHMIALKQWLTHLADQAPVRPSVRWYQIERHRTGWQQHETTPPHTHSRYEPIDIVVECTNSTLRIATVQYRNQQFNVTGTHPSAVDQLQHAFSFPQKREKTKRLVRYCRVLGDVPKNIAPLLQLKHTLEQALNT